MASRLRLRRIADPTAYRALAAFRCGSGLSAREVDGKLADLHAGRGEQMALVVLEVDGSLASVCGVSLLAGVGGYVNLLGTGYDHQRRGFGFITFCAGVTIINRGTGTPMRPMFTLVDQGNRASRRLIGRAGFRPVESDKAGELFRRVPGSSPLLPTLLERPAA
jgi:hypothetical protein